MAKTPAEEIAITSLESIARCLEEFHRATNGMGGPTIGREALTANRIWLETYIAMLKSKV